MSVIETILFWIGFVLVILYLIFGIDDVVWDIISLVKRKSYNKQHLDMSLLESTPPKLLAIGIAAWHESNVIESVVKNVIESNCYPESMYHLFIGVYPNDPETVAKVQRLESQYSNIHAVINNMDGPTSKAQNLNNVIRQMKAYEQANGLRFAALNIHDSEDVIHPFELYATNYYIDQYDALQFPVFPILRMPTFKNFFSSMTTATYADEFAENHFFTMVGRYSTGAFVPSAGTGLALSHKVLDSFGDDDVLPGESLTEDYRLSLTLYERGLQLYYVLEKLPRVQSNGKVRWDYICTRSLFPKTFRKAVRQKTRWIYGIAKSLEEHEYRKARLSVFGRYSIYRDAKAKYGNLVLLLGYLVMIYMIVSLFVSLPPIYRIGTFPYISGFVVTAMMIIRQFYRAVAISKVYGLRSMFFSTLLPPLFPIRLMYGNIISLVSTLRAFYRKHQDRKKEKKEAGTEKALQTQLPAKKEEKQPLRRKAVVWDKTDHEFLSKAVLRRYHRRTGDILLMHGWLTAEALAEALEHAKKSNVRIGAYLKSQGLISEQQLLQALARVEHTTFIPDELAQKLVPSVSFDAYDSEQLRRLGVLPLLEEKGLLIVAVCDETSMDDVSALFSERPYRKVYMTREMIGRQLDALSSENQQFFLHYTKQLHEAGKLSYEQLLMTGKYCIQLAKPEKEILSHMGLERGDAADALSTAEEAYSDPQLSPLPYRKIRQVSVSHD